MDFSFDKRGDALHQIPFLPADEDKEDHQQGGVDDQGQDGVLDVDVFLCII